MSRLARIAVVGGDTAGARAVAGAVVSLLTAVGRWVEEVPTGADLDPYAAVVLPRSRGWRTVRERYAGPLVVVDADLLGGRPDVEFLPLLSGAPRATLAIGDTHALLPCPLPPLAGPPPGDAPRGLVARAPSGAAYALPVVVSPALRTVAGFWSLAALVEQTVAGVLNEQTALYAAPWPRGEADIFLSINCRLASIVVDVSKTLNTFLVEFVEAAFHMNCGWPDNWR